MFKPNSPPPFGGLQGGGDSSLPESHGRERLLRASARPASVDATRPWSLSEAVAALEASHWQLASREREPTGMRLLEASPVLAEIPLPLLARAAWLKAGHHDLRLSLSQRTSLETAGGQIDRAGYGPLPPGRGAAAAAIIDLAAGDWAEHWHIGGRRQLDAKAPATPGAIAICARRLAHKLLAGWRSRRRSAAEGSRG